MGDTRHSTRDHGGVSTGVDREDVVHRAQYIPTVAILVRVVVPRVCVQPEAVKHLLRPDETVATLRALAFFGFLRRYFLTHRFDFRSVQSDEKGLIIVRNRVKECASWRNVFAFIND